MSATSENHLTIIETKLDALSAFIKAELKTVEGSNEVIHRLLEDALAAKHAKKATTAAAASTSTPAKAAGPIVKRDSKLNYYRRRFKEDETFRAKFKDAVSKVEGNKEVVEAKEANKIGKIAGLSYRLVVGDAALNKIFNDEYAVYKGTTTSMNPDEEEHLDDTEEETAKPEKPEKKTTKK